MGDHYSSDTTVGSIITNMYKLLVTAAVISVASCEAEAEADPGYFYGAYPAIYNAYPNWPGVSTPYSQSTCYGCRPYGKRSADAEAEPGYLYAPYHYGAYGYPGYGYGYRAATSFVARSPQGLRGKRSADAEPGYLAYGYGYAPLYSASSYGVSQIHPGYASSFQAVTRF